MFRRISGSLYALLSGTMSSNTYLIKGDKSSNEKTILIDPGAQMNAMQLKSSLKFLSLNPESIDAVIYTHGHVDHFSTPLEFKNAKHIMHIHDAGFVNARDRKFTCAELILGTHFPKIDTFISGSDSVESGSLAFEVLSTPGHTKGSVSLYEKKRQILISGDTLFEGSLGRYDLPSGSREELIASAKKLLSLQISALLPGHGALVSGIAANRRNINESLVSL